MPYQRVDLPLDENADFILSPPWVWLDASGAAITLVGYTASMMIRADRADVAPLLTLSQTSGIALGGVAGTIGVTVTQAQVNALVAALLPKQRLLAFYDLLLTSAGAIHTRFSEGVIRIDRAATR